MKKNCFVFLFFCFGCVFNVFAQTSGIPRASKEHDRMIEIVEVSQNAIVPENAINQLKAFAKEKGYSENAVLKNTFYLKPLYNKNLSREDRLFAANYLLNDSKLDHATYPTALVENVIKTIQ